MRKIGHYEQGWFPKDRHLWYVQFFYKTTSDWFKGAIFFGVFSFEALCLVNVKNDAGWSNKEKNFLPIANQVPNEQNIE